MSEPSDPSFGVELGIIPYDRSYWVVPGRLLAGFFPASPDPDETTVKLRALLAVGVRHVVNLTEAVEGNHDGLTLLDYEAELRALADAMQVAVSHQRSAVVDLGVPTLEQMTAILDAIDHAIGKGKPVYVHCWGGRGRTATVVGCYLARHGMAVGERALSMIRYLRRTDAKADSAAPESRAQKDFVRNWKIGQ